LWDVLQETAYYEDRVYGKCKYVSIIFGLGMALLSPLAFGFVLDIAGSGVHGWGFAFAALGLVSMSGPLWLRFPRTRD